MKKPDFYNDIFYNKEAVVKVTSESLGRTNAGFAGKVIVGQEISLPIELTDIFGRADCKIGSFSHNFYFRTPNGVNMKFYSSAKQLEKSVRLSIVKRGFEFVRWKDVETRF
jgi:hypothetical protein